ncbi:MAG: hypothetical protein OHK0045_02790 [Raineya sp.]
MIENGIAEIMKVSTKKWLTVCFLLFTWLPFLFLTDFYPFLRFGMFAEPIQPKTSQETFEIYTEENQKLAKYNTYLWGLDAEVFNYLARKHYYQKSLDFFGETLCAAHKKLYPQSRQKWLLYRHFVENGLWQKELIAIYEVQP